MNYPYANGTIKVLETDLLQKNKLSKLLKLSPEECLKAVKEMGYGTGEGENIEEIIVNEQKATRHLLEEVTPDRAAIDLLYTANDALNIKAQYKKQTFGVDHFNYFSEAGTLSKNQLDDVASGNTKSVSKAWAKLFQSMSEKIKGEENPRLISAQIDQMIYDFILLQNKNQTLASYFRTRIDIANIMTFVRSRRLGWPKEEAKKMLLQGGVIPRDVLLDAYSSDGDVEKKFAFYYNERISRLLVDYKLERSLTKLERSLDQFLLDEMKVYRFDSFGVGPMLYYFLEKEAEAKNIRLLYEDSSMDLADLLDF